MMSRKGIIQSRFHGYWNKLAKAGIDLEKAFVEAREDEDRYLKSRNV